MQTQLVLVGGFLGAGKTTLLRQAALLLRDQGKRVGLITNDQAADLVDTALLRQEKLAVQEIAGGCFCCRFDQLIEAANALVTQVAPDIIIGEPVGSCTDLSATVLQPIKDKYAGAYRLAPFSVLVDPGRLLDVLDPRRQIAMHASAHYILQKQLEEADLIVINKRDLLSAQEQQDIVAATRNRFPGKPVFLISALTGEGVAEWLESVLSGAAVGTHIADVDYDIYAEGEAVLGWLNATVSLRAAADADWAALGLTILNHIKQAANERQSEIAHVKLSLSTEAGQYVANLTSSNGTPTMRGRIEGNPRTATLTINARVEMAPEELQSIVEEALNRVADEQLTAHIDALHSLRPGRPMPTHRYSTVV